MLLLVAVLTLAAEPGAVVATVQSLERVPLPVAPGAVEVDALGARIELRRVRGARAVAERLSRQVGQICPNAEAHGDDVVLRCRTRRITARLTPGRPVLEIRELRGLPAGPGWTMTTFYDPARVGLGPGCPGELPAARGECALRAGRAAEAARAFEAALGDARQTNLAALRLGDIAVERGDVEGGLRWYRSARPTDPFGRLAVARVCEVTGECLGVTDAIFEAAGLPEPIHTELTLRGARMAAFEGRAALAVRRLRRAMLPLGEGCAELGGELCRRVLLAALQHEETGADAVELYLELPDRQGGPLAYRLVRAAAEKAAALGAPEFGANLLAATALPVEAEAAADHLLRTAELYLDGADRERAGVVFEYAETRVPRKRLAEPRWASVRAAVRTDGGGALAAWELLAAEGARDLAQAWSAVARARLGDR